jgi:hypothetical protein
MTGEVGAGKHGAMRRAILRGALVGLGLGIVLGVLVVLSLESSLCGSAANCAVSGTGFLFLLSAGAGLLGGGLVGLVVGLLLALHRRS